MKKIISAVLALTVLLSMCACNGDVAETETSDVSSPPVISIDPSSMLSSDSPSSDIPSNEGSKPGENETVDPPEDTETYRGITSAELVKLLNSPGAVVDDVICFVSAPKNGSIWSVSKYDMKTKKSFHLFDFNYRCEPNANFSVKRAEEYVDNILEVNCGEEDFLIDLDRGCIYTTPTPYLNKKIIPVTHEKLTAHKNGQFEVWGESHSKYGRVKYYCVDEVNLGLFTVFEKHGELIATYYDYTTKEMKEIFSSATNAPMRYLGNKMLSCTTGEAYIFDFEQNTNKRISSYTVRYTLEEKYNCKYSEFNIVAEAQSLNGDMVYRDDHVWFCVPHSNGTDTIVVYYDAHSQNEGEMGSMLFKNTYTMPGDTFITVGNETYIKLYKRESENNEFMLFSCSRDGMYADSNSYYDSKVYIGETADTYLSYTLIDGEYVWVERDASQLGVDRTEETTQPELFDKDDVLNNTGVVIGDTLWLFEFTEHAELKVYSHDLKTKQTQFVIKYENIDRDIYERGFYVETYKTADGYAVEFLDSWSDPPCYFVVNLPSMETGDPEYSEEESERKVAVRTNKDITKPRKLSDGVIEIPKTHEEYGEVWEATYIPDTDSLLIIYQNGEYHGYNCLVRCDYLTNKYTKLLESNDMAMDYSKPYGRYIFIAERPYMDGEWDFSNVTLYIYDVKARKVTSMPVSKGEEYQFIYDTYFMDYKVEYFDGYFWWFEESGITADVVYPKTSLALYCYDPATNKKREILKVNEDIPSWKDLWNSYRIVNDKAIIVKTGSRLEGYSSMGKLYYCTAHKTICISEKVLRHHVCEDQGYVMYYEEQADGSFEWKYYYF